MASSAAPPPGRRSTRQPRSTARSAAYHVRPQTPGFFPAITHFTDSVAALPKEIIKHFSMLREVEAKAHVPDTELRDLIQPDEEDEVDVDRRRRFLRVGDILRGMAVILDEKNAVLATANQSLTNQLARMDSSFPYIDDEISYEARCGNPNHWAYIDKETRKAGANERARRDVASANNLAAAAAAINEGEFASRSEARREAMMANKRHRNQQHDSDFEDRSVRKVNAGNRGRRVADVDPRGNGVNSAGGGQGNKRRKTEKATAATGMERSLSQAMSAANGAGGGRGHGSSPRSTPAVEGGKKKIKAPPAPAPARKRTQAAVAQSPPVASSPVQGTFGPSKDFTSAPQRPHSSRARQGSNTNASQSAAQESRARPAPATSNRPAQLLQTPSVDEPAVRGAPGGAKNNQSSALDASSRAPVQLNALLPTDSNALKREDDSPAGPVDSHEPIRPALPPPAPAAVVTRAGRTSKTATPITATFPDMPPARSRPARNAVEEEEEDEDDEDEDGEEQRYCYCNQGSYGDMVACDNEDCPREWFHLTCVGLSRPPSTKSTWYCDDCKENIRKSRPVSRQ